MRERTDCHRMTPLPTKRILAHVISFAILCKVRWIYPNVSRHLLLVEDNAMYCIFCGAIFTRSFTCTSSSRMYYQTLQGMDVLRNTK